MPPARPVTLGARDLVWVRAPAAGWRPVLAAAFGALVVAALALSTLRNQIISHRYRLAEVVREERALLEQKRDLTVRVRRLRDPKRLAEIARQRGFDRPERLVHLGARDPAP